MSAQVSYIAAEERLDITIRGNLDLSVAEEIHELCSRVPPALSCCIVDLYEVERLFDSGVALIRMLHRRMSEAGAIVIILTDNREIHRRLSCIAESLFPVAEAASSAG